MDTTEAVSKAPVNIFLWVRFTERWTVPRPRKSATLVLKRPLGTSAYTRSVKRSHAAGSVAHTRIRQPTGERRAVGLQIVRGDGDGGPGVGSDGGERGLDACLLYTSDAADE